MHDVIPGILEKDLQEIEKKLQIIKPFSRRVHIDILDGKFFESVSFLDPKPFAKYKDDFFMEVHFMVENPVEYLKPFAAAGFKRFLGHVEKMQGYGGICRRRTNIRGSRTCFDFETPIEFNKCSF